MKKLISFGMVVLGFLLLSSKAEAGSPSRGAKASFSLNYTTTISSVVLNGPAVVYAVYQATGAASEFVALFDSATVAGINVTTTQTANVLKSRCFFGSTTANSVGCVFDPPLQFNNGIIAADSAATGQSLIVYEKGRLNQGY